MWGAAKSGFIVTEYHSAFPACTRAIVGATQRRGVLHGTLRRVPQGVQVGRFYL
ncbi:hypothetical protein GCM10009849_20990 [Sinomonas flava]|uniref:Uncharacterized protein n=1 Tax=Sinomonas flava TaxID=496857 RepID=A0ABP5NQI3_9MICC